MNKHIYIALLAAPLLLLASCKKESLTTYNTDDNIYFAYRGPIAVNPITDSANMTFAYSTAAVMDSIFKIPVAVTGTPKSYDRTYVITADDASTAMAGRHYVFPAAFTIRAGKVLDTLPLRLLRTPDLKTGTVTLLLHLQRNQNFITGVKNIYGSDTFNVLSFKLYMGDILTAGPYWNSVFATFFGTFSVKKVMLLNQIAGMPLNFFSDLNAAGLTLNSAAALYAITASRYLKDQATAGNTIYDEDGITPMAMGAAYQ